MGRGGAGGTPANEQTGEGEAAAPPAPLSMGGIEAIRFGADGLVPAVVQDRRTREVLMVGFMNRDMLAKTLETGEAWFWSRSRQEPWHKGATSGNYIRVREVRRNCEDNSLLLLTDPVGPVCHTGAQTCYYRTLDGQTLRPLPAAELGAGVGGEGDLTWLFEILRQPARREDSYVARLLTGGVDRIGKKIGEEAAEVIIAAKNRSPEELSWEMADLWFHSLVLLLDGGLTPADVYRVLSQRHREKTSHP